MPKAAIQLCTVYIYSVGNHPSPPGKILIFSRFCSNSKTDPNKNGRSGPRFTSWLCQCRVQGWELWIGDIHWSYPDIQIMQHTLKWPAQCLRPNIIKENCLTVKWKMKFLVCRNCLSLHWALWLEVRWQCGLCVGFGSTYRWPSICIARKSSSTWWYLQWSVFQSATTMVQWQIAVSWT